MNKNLIVLELVEIMKYFLRIDLKYKVDLILEKESRIEGMELVMIMEVTEIKEIENSLQYSKDNYLLKETINNSKYLIQVNNN